MSVARDPNVLLTPVSQWDNFGSSLLQYFFYLLIVPLTILVLFCVLPRMNTSGKAGINDSRMN